MSDDRSVPLTFRGELQSKVRSKVDQNIKDETDNTNRRIAYFTFARFQPPVSSFRQVLDSVNELKANYLKENEAAACDFFIFPSHIQDAENNPLDPHTKVLFFRKMFPDAPIIFDPSCSDLTCIINSILADGYNEIVFVTDASKIQSFKTLLGSQHIDKPIRIIGIDHEHSDVTYTEEQVLDFARQCDFTYSDTYKMEDAIILMNFIREGLTLSPCI